MATKAEQFFYRHAGYARRTGESEETARRRGARALAQAEAEAKRRGWTYDWSFDEDPDVSWMDKKQREDFEAGRTEMWSVLLRDKQGKVLASLGGVHLEATGPNPHQRVVEAELAAEALNKALNNPFTTFPRMFG